MYLFDYELLMNIIWRINKDTNSIFKYIFLNNFRCLYNVLVCALPLLARVLYGRWEEVKWLPGYKGNAGRFHRFIWMPALGWDASVHVAASIGYKKFETRFEFHPSSPKVGVSSRKFSKFRCLFCGLVSVQWYGKWHS